jgi:hypothetical protein
MAKAREALAQSDIDAAVTAERERCAWLCEELAGRWERSAAKLREDGSYTTRAVWPPGKKVTCVKPKWHQAALDTEAAAHGLRTVARGIREGWDDPNRPGADPYRLVADALRERLTAEINDAEAAARQKDEAVHGVRFFAGGDRPRSVGRHPALAAPYSISGVRTAIWPCDNYPV